ncbi:hypothetical protein [Emergencia sp.]|uniref:hypothetical protein n=1 Tax=Emergencia sp. TaxID=1926557 RepID=UPI003AF11C8F
MKYYIVGIDSTLVDAGLSSEPDLAIIARFFELKEAECFLEDCSQDLEHLSYKIVASFI